MLIRLCFSCIAAALVWVSADASAQGAEDTSTMDGNAVESGAVEGDAAEHQPAMHRPADYYTVERYRALEGELQELDLARVAVPPHTDERRLATEAAIQHRRELMSFITGWMRAGTLSDAAVAQAREARLVLVENIVQLSVEIGYCDDARASLSLIRGFGQGDDGQQAIYDAAVDAVESCIPVSPEREALAAVDPEAAESSAGNTAAPSDDPGEVATSESQAQDSGGRPELYPVQPLVSMRSVDPIAAVLIGLGGTFLVSGTAWNFALLDNRAQYLDDRAACVELGTACQDAESARSVLRGAKAPIAAFIAGGAVVTAVGVLLQVRSRRAHDQARVRLTPTASGFALSFGRVRP